MLSGIEFLPALVGLVYDSCPNYTEDVKHVIHAL